MSDEPRQRPLTERQKMLLAMDRAEWWRYTLRQASNRLMDEREFIKAGRAWDLAHRATMRYYDLAMQLMNERSREFGFEKEEDHAT